MKRIVSIVLLLALLLCGCVKSGRDMNWVISNEPSVRGIVEEIGEETVTLRITRSDDPALSVGDVVLAEKATRLNDCSFYANIGDEVEVFYDSGTPIDPNGTPAIRNIHGYCLITPAKREGNG